jgi:hypothetical protein
MGALPPDVVDEIVERTDGVPLFVEELTKAVVEAGADRGYASISAVPPSSLAVPNTANWHQRVAPNHISHFTNKCVGPRRFARSRCRVAPGS